jgi:NAD(P)-dependent dehydrogenase (short-subunit alcohol dehydrogenase family)
LVTVGPAASGALSCGGSSKTAPQSCSPTTATKPKPDQLVGEIGEVDRKIHALLARPDSRWITGQNIRADGGLI